MADTILNIGTKDKWKRHREIYEKHGYNNKNEEERKEDSDAIKNDVQADSDRETIINAVVGMIRPLFAWHSGAQDCKIKVNGTDLIEPRGRRLGINRPTKWAAIKAPGCKLDGV